MNDQFPNLYAITGGSFNELVLRGLEFDMEFQTTEVKRELREYRQFQKEFDNFKHYLELP